MRGPSREDVHQRSRLALRNDMSETCRAMGATV